MARGWRYTKLSLSSAVLRVCVMHSFSISWVTCASLHPTYLCWHLLLCCFLFLFCFVFAFLFAIMLSLELLVDIPLIFFRSSRPQTG